MASSASLDRLRLLHAVATSGTIAAAARAQGYTASAVSQQLALLEREVGTSLLDRSNRGVTLTPAGRLLSQRASVILDLVQSALDDVGRVTSDAAPVTVRIAAFPTAVTAIVLPAVALLAPGVRLQIVDLEPEHALAALAARTVDAAVVDRYTAEPLASPAGLEVATMLVEPVRLVHGSDRRPRSLSALADVPWVLGGRGSRLGQATRAICHAHGFEPHVVVESDDHHVTFDAIRALRAVTLLPDLALGVLPVGIRVARSVDSGCSRHVDLVTRRVPRRNPALIALESALRASAI